MRRLRRDKKRHDGIADVWKHSAVTVAGGDWSAFPLPDNIQNLLGDELIAAVRMPAKQS
jgi:hypothetical protein